MVTSEGEKLEEYLDRQVDTIPSFVRWFGEELDRIFGHRAKPPRRAKREPQKRDNFIRERQDPG